MPQKLNKEWHLKHPIPKQANIEVRIKWHVQHAKHCGCRGIPETIKEELIKRNKY